MEPRRELRGAAALHDHLPGLQQRHPGAALGRDVRLHPQILVRVPLVPLLVLVPIFTMPSPSVRFSQGHDQAHVASGGVKRPDGMFVYSLVDNIVVPKTPGDYILSWRWVRVPNPRSLVGSFSLRRFC